METIKISLAKPIQALSPLNIKWEECTESGNVLTLVLRNMGTKSLSVGDTILFRRSGTIEEEYQYGSDGMPTSTTWNMDIIVEQEVKVISVIDDNTFEVEAPRKVALLCTACTYNDTLRKWVINGDVEHTIFYQDVEIASSNPIKVVYGDAENRSCVYATNHGVDTIGIASSYTKYTKALTEDCGGNQEIPYDYFFIPNRESRLIFLCDDEIPEGTIVSFTQNDFYFVDREGKCTPWTDSGYTIDGIPQTVVNVYKDTGYWNVPVGFVQNADYVRLYEEDRVNTLFFEKVKKNLIPPTINMERFKYAPIIYKNDEVSIVCGITFNLHFRYRGDDENWNASRGSGWNTCSPSETADTNFMKSDSLCYLDFVDNDVQYQKMKVKKSFIRLSFYSSNDPLSQSLLYYSTIFLDSGYLFGQFNKKRTELVSQKRVWDVKDDPKYVLIAASEDGSDVRIDSQITVHNEFNMAKSSEGFNIYLFADDSEIVDKDKDYRTIYMKVEFNHAGNGKTLPFIVWPNHVGDDELTVDKYFENVYIPLRIQHINDRYYYYFDDSDKYPYVQCDKDAKSITFNLFEPKLKREKV